MYPGDDRSCCRYLLVLCLVVGGVLPLLGPAVGIFVADPIIQLALVLAPVSGAGPGGAIPGSAGRRSYAPSCAHAR